MIELELGKIENFHYLVIEAQGHDNLSFLEKDTRINLNKKNICLRLGNGDAAAI